MRVGWADIRFCRGDVLNELTPLVGDGVEQRSNASNVLSFDIRTVSEQDIGNFHTTI